MKRIKEQIDKDKEQGKDSKLENLIEDRPQIF